MPPQPFIDIDSLDMEQVVADQDEIYSLLPHRYEFMRLDRICLLDTDLGVMAGYVDLRDDDFWVRGHIPGRPIFPGVMMIETAAQLVSYYTMKSQEGEGFLGFGGVDGVKFRGSVEPGQRVVMLGRMVEMRKRRCIGETQAFVDGKMVYEGTITGMWI
jgi:3-hydroxyacyl-[acyl-carrier-protein] dehydratase